MILSRTPFRVSLFGGGTDFPAWYRAHTGLVVSATVKKYCYVTVRYRPPFFEHKYRIGCARQQYAGSLDEIRHPSVRECIRYLGITEGLEIQHSSDVPARSGLGSSSAFTVGLLHALRALTGQLSGKRLLADQAIDVEQNRVGERVGSQDQIAAAFGGINVITFGPDDRYDVAPVTLGPAAVAGVESHFLLCFTGQRQRIVASQQRHPSGHASELEEIAGIARQAVSLFDRPAVDMQEIARLLDLQWQIKRRLSTLIATPAIVNIYEMGMRAGACGAKLLGAGGGGFMLFIAPPEAHAAIRAALAPLLFVPVQLEQDGSQIVYGTPSGTKI